jgi:hypothetical protein
MAEDGGNGLHRFGIGSELRVQNTILANGPGTECAVLLPTSDGDNIASDDSCGLTASGDMQDTDAELGDLDDDNGGPTETHLPQPGSPAINAAADEDVENDQRGVDRPQGPAPDIGSVEGSGATVEIWWPIEGTVVEGVQPVKAILQGFDVDEYQMFWQVEGGPEVAMFNNFQGFPHKKAYINYGSWDWDPTGDYVLTFIARIGGEVVGEASVGIHVEL